jgi:hypothetical protein
MTIHFLNILMYHGDMRENLSVLYFASTSVGAPTEIDYWSAVENDVVG